MRIGTVVKVLPEKKVGFIRSDDLSEDVFFHFSKVEKVGTRPLEDGDEVEYEIDELHRLQKIRLQATRVRRSVRPLSMKLKPSDAPGLRAQHHPKARKKRPAWRGKSKSDDTQ
ncbi:MAG: cold shock domain-containing protein [Pirellulaceae bacterium]|nr:cold shock domain-containing protein [Pirellulaceae bacterium]